MTWTDPIGPRPRHRSPTPAASEPPVLYAVVCGSPVAGHVGQLVAYAQRTGWQVCVVATPDGRKFLDVPAVAAQTGHPVRSEYKNPGDVDVLPAADAMVVAPATVNTINKWACGITDTFALGLLIEGYGLGLPMAAVPFTNQAMAAHPAFQNSLAQLRRWGVRVLFGDEVVAMPPPGGASRWASEFPWERAVSVVGPPRSRRLRPPRQSSPVGPSRGTWGPAPPTAPTPAPAIPRRS